MSVEFTTPLPVTFQHMRFVFFFVEQPVADSFDNIPQFYLDIAEKASPENMQRLYVCCKPIEPPEGYWPDKGFQVDVMIDDTVKEFRAYVKKHFGSKCIVLDVMPDTQGLETNAVETSIALAYKRICYESVDEAYFTAKNNKEQDYSVIEVGPGGLSSLRLYFYNKDFEHGHYYKTVCTGNAVLFGEPMIFVLYPNTYMPGWGHKDYQLDTDTLRKFVTPSLIETVVNNTIRAAIGHPSTTTDLYIYEVEIDNPEVETDDE